MKSIEDNKIKNNGSIIEGILFISLAIIIGIHLFNILTFEGWWTLFIIIPSILILIKNEDKKGGIIGLIVGTLLFISQQGIINFNFVWKLTVILFLLVIGASLIFNSDK